MLNMLCKKNCNNTVYLDKLMNHHEELMLHLEPDSQAIVYDIYTTAQTRSVNIVVSERAQLTYVYDQQLSQNTQEISKIHVSLMERSTVRALVMITGTCTLSFDVHLQGEYASAHIGGFYQLDHDHHAAITTTQHHHKGFTKSTVALYGIVADCARVDYNGLIVIEQHTVQSQAEQINKNILLGHRARVVSIPTLEVKTAMVQCKHGAAVGQLDEEQLVYLQTRGLSLEQAQQLIISAFLVQSCAMMPHELQTLMHKKIDGIKYEKFTK